MQPDFSVPPPPVLSNLMTQPPPSLSVRYNQGTGSLNTIAVEGCKQALVHDNESNATKYSPSKPTSTPTKMETNVPEPLKVESKGKHYTHRKCSMSNCHAIYWIYDRLLMGILKFS